MPPKFLSTPDEILLERHRIAANDAREFIDEHRRVVKSTSAVLTGRRKDVKKMLTKQEKLLDARLVQLNNARLLMRHARYVEKQAEQDLTDTVRSLKRTTLPFEVFGDQQFGAVWTEVVRRSNTFERFFALPLVCRRMRKVCDVEVELPRTILVTGYQCECNLRAVSRALFCILTRAPANWLQEFRVDDEWVEPHEMRVAYAGQDVSHAELYCGYCRCYVSHKVHGHSGNAMAATIRKCHEMAKKPRIGDFGFTLPGPDGEDIEHALCALANE